MQKTGKVKAQSQGHAEESQPIAAFGSHAFAEAGQGAGFLLVATLSEPALDGPHVPVELLGQALQPLLIRMLGRGVGEDSLLYPSTAQRMKCSFDETTQQQKKREFFECYLGYSSENLLQDGVGLRFLRAIGLNLQAHGTWSGNESKNRDAV